MTRFADSTKVNVERTRAEIERCLQRFGADGFAYGYEGDHHYIGFRIKGRQVRMELQLPKRDEKRFTLTPARRFQRTADEVYKAWEQGCRQRWRSLLLVVKAKLAAIQDGISTVEREFMADLVVDGRRVGDVVLPAYLRAIETNGPLLLGAAQ